MCSTLVDVDVKLHGVDVERDVDGVRVGLLALAGIELVEVNSASCGCMVTHELSFVSKS